MFIIFGDKHRTEPVPGGREVSRTCSKCGERATFRERVVSKQFRLYFIDMFTHGTHHVLECGACGTAFVTDELAAAQVANDHEGTVFGHIQGMAAKAEQLASSEEVARGLERGKAEAGKAYTAARDTVGGLLTGLRARVDDDQ